MNFLQNYMYWQAIYIIWLRDMTRHFRDRVRLLASLFRPLLWLLIFGTGISSFLGSATGKNTTQGENYLHFLFPGIIALNLIFASFFSAISIIWDREFGFLREILVAPIPRTAIALGKSLSGTTTALLEGLFVFLLAPLVGIRLLFSWIVPTIGIMFLISLSATALGVLIAARMTSFEGFGIVANFVVMPMFFLSGALFPIGTNLPSWLRYLVWINPLTYGVDALRNVFLGVKVFPLWFSLSFLSVFTVITVFVSVAIFNKKE